jgi:hypothetical protein
MNETAYVKTIIGDGGPLIEQIARIAQAGYDGVEEAITEYDDLRLLEDLLAEYHLICVPQILR